MSPRLGAHSLTVGGSVGADFAWSGVSRTWAGFSWEQEFKLLRAELGGAAEHVAHAELIEECARVAWTDFAQFSDDSRAGQAVPDLDVFDDPQPVVLAVPGDDQREFEVVAAAPGGARESLAEKPEVAAVREAQEVFAVSAVDDEDGFASFGVFWQGARWPADDGFGDIGHGLLQMCAGWVVLAGVLIKEITMSGEVVNGGWG